MPTGTFQEMTPPIKGMTRRLRGRSGMCAGQAGHAAEKASIEYSPSSTTPQQLIERIQHADFTVLR